MSNIFSVSFSKLSSISTVEACHLDQADAHDGRPLCAGLVVGANGAPLPGHFLGENGEGGAVLVVAGLRRAHGLEQREVRAQPPRVLVRCKHTGMAHAQMTHFTSFAETLSFLELKINISIEIKTISVVNIRFCQITAISRSSWNVSAHTSDQTLSLTKISLR